MAKLALFLFVLALVYAAKFLIQFILVVKQDNPPPMKIEPIEQGLLYVSIAYVFTYIIGSII